MKIVLTDAQTVLCDQVRADGLEKFGELVQYGLLSYDEIAEAIRDADMVICNKSVLDPHSLRLAEKLRYIGLFATGYNNIDISYCRSRGITVCNAGSYSTNAVAQQTFALILAHFNQIASYDRFVHDGRWVRSETFSPFVYPLHELAGKTLGIVGLGAIGQAVARIGVAFGMRVLGYNRSQKEVPGVTQVPLDRLLQESDVVTVHCPLNAESAGLFDRERFSMMKPGALFVNTARGGIMVEQDLFDALERGHLGGACIDVLATEPMDPACVLLHAKNCIITPHVAWAPVETRLRLMQFVETNIRSYLSGIPTNVVS